MSVLGKCILYVGVLANSSSPGGILGYDMQNPSRPIFTGGGSSFPRPVNCLCVSADQKFLVAGVGDSLKGGGVKVYDLTSAEGGKEIRDLEQGGFIDEYRANINATKLGFDLTVWIFVSLKNQNEESLRQFEKLVWGWEQVRECYMLNGEVDFILKCVSKNMEEFNNFLTNQVTSYENISSVKTAFAIKTTKSLGKVPLD